MFVSPMVEVRLDVEVAALLRVAQVPRRCLFDLVEVTQLHERREAEVPERVDLPPDREVLADEPRMAGVAPDAWSGVGREGAAHLLVGGCPLAAEVMGETASPP